MGAGGSQGAGDEGAAPASIPMMNWTALAQLTRLANQAGTLLLMLPTLWALVAASGGSPPAALIVVFVAGAFLMRTLGVVINDLIDRHIDQQVERTKTRPLASGVLDLPVALGLAATLTCLAAVLLLFLNRLTVLLSPIALAFAAFYPLSKRVVHVPQAVLGIAFGWGTVMAWAAVRNTLDEPVWLLFAGTVFWAIAYDSIYALQDRDDDERIGVKSAAIFFGRWTWMAVALASLAMIACLAYSGVLMSLGVGFYVTLIGVLAFLLWQAWRIRRPVPRNTAFTLFKQHVGVGWAVLGGYLLGFHL